MKQLIFFIMLIGSVSMLSCKTKPAFDKSKLDTYLETLDANQKFMGSVAVTQNGQLIYSKTIGDIDVANALKADANTKYRIGSISKTFTSTLIFKAIEAGKLDLNQTIEIYFPTIPNAEKITIKQLLGHRSGIHNFTDDSSYLTWYTLPKTEAEMVEIITKAGSDFEPDSEASYSNSGYVLLSYILEKTFNKPYSTIVEEQIIEPLGLTNTRVGGKINTADNDCYSYSFFDGWKLAPETDMSIPLGAGALVSNPIDLTKFSDALFAGKLVSTESLEQMKTIQDNYGLGLLQRPFYERTGYGHTGGIDGFSSVLLYFPEDNISYALVSNASNFGNNDISLAILSAIFNKPFDIPSFEKTMIQIDNFEPYLGTYASEQLPLKITISEGENTLIAQATGQSAFPLEAVTAEKFQFELGGIVMEFNLENGTFVLKQGGGQFLFTKE